MKWARWRDSAHHFCKLYNSHISLNDWLICKHNEATQHFVVILILAAFTFVHQHRISSFIVVVGAVCLSLSLCFCFIGYSPFELFISSSDNRTVKWKWDREHETYTINNHQPTTNRQYPIPYPNLNFIHSNSRPIVMVFYDFSRILSITLLLFGLYLCLRGIHNLLFYEVTVSVSATIRSEEPNSFSQ